MLSEKPSSEEYDNFIIEGLKVNDPTASSSLIDRYLDPIIHFLQKNYTISREDAEEIASTALCRVITKIDTFTPSRSKFSTWIFVIAKRLAIDNHRKQKNLRPNTGQILSLDEEHDQTHTDTPVESVSRNPVLKELFLKAFKSLSDEDQTVLNLGARGVSQAEIGEILGKSADTIRVQVHRARQKLQKALVILAREAAVDITGGDWGGLKNLKGQKEAGI